MADELISKRAVIQAMRMMPMPKRAINNDWFGAVTAGVNAEIKLVAEFPAVDAVEVVRCKDCEHWDVEGLYCHHPAGLSYCGKTAAVKGLCCFGERREENG